MAVLGNQRGECFIEACVHGVFDEHAKPLLEECVKFVVDFGHDVSFDDVHEGDEGVGEVVVGACCFFKLRA